MMRRRQPCVWNIQRPILWHELGLLNTQEDGLRRDWQGESWGSSMLVWVTRDTIGARLSFQVQLPAHLEHFKWERGVMYLTF